MAVSANANIPFFETREEYFDFFSTLSSDSVDKLEGNRLSGGLQKSYLLETSVGDPSNAERLASVMKKSRLRTETTPNDPAIYRLVNESGDGVGLLEVASSRYIILYTLLPTVESEKLIRSAVVSNPMLDHLWLPTQSFMSLWKYVRDTHDSRRYGKITFEHESIFESSGDDEFEELYEDERRASRFTMVDRIGTIERLMSPLSNTYAPLSSITHLRIPANLRGGHDVFYYGKVTNRSSSFLDHRSTLKDIISMYGQLTDRVEQSLWLPENATRSAAIDPAVAELQFSETLDEQTFRRWMLNIFNNSRNRFRIGGFANWISPRKVQANAIDLHLWQPIYLEFTLDRVVAILPSGTCGNTVNRLISNVQRYIDPQVTAFVGEANYASLVPELSLATGA